MASDFDKKAERTNKNLRQSVQSARSLGFELAGVDTRMAGAASAAASFAENIAKGSRNARLAASATGIGLLVAVLGTAVAFGIGLRERMKEVAKATVDVGRETAILNAQAKGDEREEKELRITQAMSEELDAANKLKGAFINLSGLQAAIRAKAEAARRAAAAAAAKDSSERRADFLDTQFEYRTETALIYKRMKSEEAAARTRAASNRELETREMDREAAKPLTDSTRMHDEEIASRRRDIEDRYKAELKQIEYDLQAPARQLGAGIAGAIAEGLSGITGGGSIHDRFHKAMRGITGGILIAIGDMMQDVGTKALLASSLIAKLMTLIGTPAGIPAALALIAAGGVVKGLGQALASSGGGRSNSSGGSSGGGYSTGRMSYVGVINPSAGPSTANLRAVQPVVVQATIIGRDDPNAQREILALVQRGQLRAAGG